MRFLKSTKTHNVYQFECPKCEAVGEIGVRKDEKGLVKHECGLVMIQHPARGMYGQPRLEIVNH